MKDSHKQETKPQKVKEAKQQSKEKVKEFFSLRLQSQDVWFIVPTLLLFLILLSLITYNISLKQQIVENTLLPGSPVSIADFPVLEQQLSPVLTAQSAIVVDDTSKTVLYEKNPMLRFSMASTTKIMTTLVALEHFKPKDTVTVYSDTVEGTVVGFTKEQKFFFDDMLYALMLPSGNDAAYAIADNYPGGVNAFVARMNEKAAALGLTYTHYADPAGLDDDANYTTITDLAKLASIALKNKQLSEIVGTKRKIITTVDGTEAFTLFNLNKLLGEYGVTGMKTGFTQGAGGVLVTSKVERGHTFIIVVMKSEDRFADTERLLQSVSNNVKFINPGGYVLKEASR